MTSSLIVVSGCGWAAPPSPDRGVDEAVAHPLHCCRRRRSAGSSLFSASPAWRLAAERQQSVINAHVARLLAAIGTDLQFDIFDRGDHYAGVRYGVMRAHDAPGHDMPGHRLIGNGHREMQVDIGISVDVATGSR